MNAMFNVQHHERIGSTNDEARRLAAAGAPHGTVVHADEQAAGRGRFGRTWFSPPGNLYLSVLLRLDLPPERVSELSFVTALTVADAIDALLPKQSKSTLKWPNDVLVNDGKIAGILVESVDGAQIIGIGVNVLEAPRNAPYKTATLVGAGGIATVDGARDILLDSLAKHLEFLDRTWLRTDPGRLAGTRSPDRHTAAGQYRRTDRGRIVRRPGRQRGDAAGYAGRAETYRRRRGERGGCLKD